MRLPCFVLQGKYVMKIINILMKMVILKQLAKRVSRPKGPKATDAFIDFSPCGRRPKGCFSLDFSPFGRRPKGSASELRFRVGASLCR